MQNKVITLILSGSLLITNAHGQGDACQEEQSRQSSWRDYSWSALSIAVGLGAYYLVDRTTSIDARYKNTGSPYVSLKDLTLADKITHTIRNAIEFYNLKKDRIAVGVGAGAVTYFGPRKAFNNLQTALGVLIMKGFNPISAALNADGIIKNFPMKDRS
jgi:hypothetical protein